MKPSDASGSTERAADHRRRLGHAIAGARSAAAARCRIRGTWSIPGSVEAVARAYVDAGSQVILTNTFRANAITLARRAWRSWRRSIAPAWQISKRARRDGRWSLPRSGPRARC